MQHVSVRGVTSPRPEPYQAERRNRLKEGTFGCRQSSDGIGVLMAQLGTPDAPTPQALRTYLKQFLWDPRVIEINRVLWWFILNGIILNVRPKRSAALYRRIWTDQGSPLLLITQEQVAQLQQNLQTVAPSVRVAFGMRYGSPSLQQAIDQLIEQGCTKILLVPMYPQYSAPTSASVYDAVYPHLLQRRFVPTLRVVEPFYADPRYIRSLTSIIQESYTSFPTRPEKLLLSFHGIPQSYVDQGDPYCCHCTETTFALRRELTAAGFSQDEIIQTYQSRFGNDPWLQPYTDETIENLAKQGIKRIAVACPGFLADCLETIDEIGHEAQLTFREHGGEELHLIPCLNTHPTWIEGLTEMIMAELGSWLDTAKHMAQENCLVKCPVAQNRAMQRKQTQPG